MTTTYKATQRRKTERRIIRAKTHAELLDAAEASMGVLSDEQFADALDDREHAERELLLAIESICRRHAHPGCNTGAHALACLILGRIERRQ